MDMKLDKRGKSGVEKLDLGEGKMSGSPLAVISRVGTREDCLSGLIIDTGKERKKERGLRIIDGIEWKSRPLEG